MKGQGKGREEQGRHGERGQLRPKPQPSSSSSSSSFFPLPSSPTYPSLRQCSLA
jgi:hypothetical protein